MLTRVVHADYPDSWTNTLYDGTRADIVHTPRNETI